MQVGITSETEKVFRKTSTITKRRAKSYTCWDGGWKH